MVATSCVLQAPSARVQKSQTTQRRSLVIANAKPNKRQGLPLGFVEEDNSGRSNIFAVEPKQVWTSSPRSDRVASQGLGGAQGLGLIVGIAALVGVAAFVVAGNTGPTELAATGESLSAIAGRISATL